MGFQALRWILVGALALWPVLGWSEEALTPFQQLQQTAEQLTPSAEQQLVPVTQVLTLSVYSSGSANMLACFYYVFGVFVCIC